jgi:hypothetical protein
MTMATQDGRLYVISGASRSGKTAWTTRAVARAPRVMAWDPEDQWSQLRGWRKVTTRKALAEAMAKPGPMKVAYVTGGKLAEEFEFWAACVMYAGRYVEPLSAIAEELADVSTPSKAPQSWGMLIRRGLKRGITIYAISQRWAEADKTAVGNASEFILFRQSSGDDVRYLVRKARVPEDQLAGLAQLEYLQKCAITGNLQRGKLKF